MRLHLPYNNSLDTLVRDSSYTIVSGTTVTYVANCAALLAMENISLIEVQVSLKRARFFFFLVTFPALS